jgi:DMSO/TMAO reductase YedYZ molybdopterin-dependent catalytic subunit
VLWQQPAGDAGVVVERPLHGRAAARGAEAGGVGDAAREVVFFGADRGKEDVVFRQQTFKIEQQFARSITLENAQKPSRCWSTRSTDSRSPATAAFPVRLVMPGWYGVANVKWLSEIHLQEGRFLGNYQARWYRTVRTVGGTGTETDPETQWVETEVTRLNLKSVIARVTKLGGAHRVRGWVLNDGTPCGRWR